MPQGYDEPQVQQAPMTNAKAQGDPGLASFGGGEANQQATNAAAQTADTAAGVFYERAKQKRELSDLTANYGAAAQLSELQTRLLYDPKTGALQQKGANAAGIYTPTMDAWNKGTAEIEKNLVTPEQKQAFARAKFSHQVELDRELQRHQSEQQVETTKETVTSAAARFDNSAIAKAITDPTGAQMDIRRGNASRTELARLRGMTPESAQEFIEKGESATQLKILNSYLSTGQDLSAKAYFDQNKDRFRGEDLIHAQNSVFEGSAMGQAQRNADKIFAPTYGTSDQGPTMTPGAKTLGEALDKAREVQDPKVREYTVKEVKTRWEQTQEDVKQQRTAMTNKLAGVAEKTGSVDAIIAADPDWWYNTATGAERTELVKLAGDKAARRDPETDKTEWGKLIDKAKNPSTEVEFAQMNLDDPYYRNRLSTENWKALKSMQGDVITKTAKTDGKLSFQNRLTDYVGHSGIFEHEMDALDSKEKQRLSFFSHQLDADYDKYKRTVLMGARELNDKEQDSLIDARFGDRKEIQAWFTNATGRTGWSSTSGNRHLPASMILPDDKVVTQRGFFSNSVVPGSTMTPNESEAIKAAQAANQPVDSARWTEMLKKLGKTVTPDKIQRIHTAFLKNDAETIRRITENE